MEKIGNQKLVYDTETMYSLCGGNSQLCSYDFSLIASTIYQPFFNTLPNIIYKKVAKLQFSCDAQYKIKTATKFNEQNHEVVSKSIFKQNPTFVAYLAKIVSVVLPKTKKLKSLQFSRIDFTQQQIRSIFKSIYLCKTLQSISFQHININDDDFIELLSHINPYQYAEITFFDCNLTSASFPAIKNFITKRPTTMPVNRKLMIFNVDECKFTDKELEEIEYMVNDAQDDKTTIDSTTITHTTDITNTMNDYEEDYEEDYDSKGNIANRDANVSDEYGTYSEELTNDVTTQKLRKMTDNFTFPKHHVLKSPQIRESFLTSNKSIASKIQQQLDEVELSIFSNIDKLPDPETLSEDDLYKQNEELKSIFEKLKSIYKVAEYSDDVLVVGKGSNDFVEVIKNMKKDIKRFKC